MKYFTSLLLVFFLFQSAAAQSNGLSDKQVAIDQLMQHSYDYGIFNGTILVSVDGKEIYSNALGYADKNNGRKLNKSTSVYLASVSKQFTTMAIMILKEQNKLSYENTLADLFSRIFQNMQKK